MGTILTKRTGLMVGKKGRPATFCIFCVLVARAVSAEPHQHSAVSFVIGLAEWYIQETAA